MAQLFISAVTDEFGSYRRALAADLDRPGVRVETQEKFLAHGVATLDLLDEYIERCDAVIHIVGDQTGAFPGKEATAALKERYPELSRRLQLSEAAIDALSYTQWEALLAVLHQKRLFIATPTREASRDRPLTNPDEAAEQRERQQNHLAHLMEMSASD